MRRELFTVIPVARHVKTRTSGKSQQVFLTLFQRLFQCGSVGSPNPRPGKAVPGLLSRQVVFVDSRPAAEPIRWTALLLLPRAVGDMNSGCLTWSASGVPAGEGTIEETTNIPIGMLLPSSCCACIAITRDNRSSSRSAAGLNTGHGQEKTAKGLGPTTACVRLGGRPLCWLEEVSRTPLPVCPASRVSTSSKLVQEEAGKQIRGPDSGRTLESCDGRLTRTCLEVYNWVFRPRTSNPAEFVRICWSDQIPVRECLPVDRSCEKREHD